MTTTSKYVQPKELLFGNEAYETFDAKVYLANVYRPKTDEFQMMIMETLYNEFNSGRHAGGGRLLDLASGPSIMQVMSGSKYYTDITLTDYGQPNRDELHAWKARHEDAFDWSRYFDNAAKLESTSADVIIDRMYARVTSVLYCDINLANPLSPHEGELYDCILSCLTLEATSKDEQQLQLQVQNLANLLHVGGKLVLSGGIENAWYGFGEKSECGVEKAYHSQRLTEDMLRRAVVLAGCTVVEYKEVTTPKMPRELLKAFFCLTAVKQGTSGATP